METARLTDPAQAARLIECGKLVAFPTETVFGLGIDATNSGAAARLYAAKGRPADNPLIVHLGRVSDWSLAARELPPSAEALCRTFSPGPLTVVLPKHERIVPAVTAHLDTVGIRVPGCEIARQMLQCCSVPVAAPSANLSGRPSCTRWQSVLEDLDGRINAILCRNPTAVGLESTVVDCSREPPMVLRHGAVSLEQMRRVLPEILVASAPHVPNQKNIAELRSPGLAHPHYQPNAPVLLFQEGLSELQLDSRQLPELAVCGLAETLGIPANRPVRYSRLFEDLSEYAANFYEFLRESDRRAATLIACQLAPSVGIGVALRDRQQRAAGLVPWVPRGESGT